MAEDYRAMHKRSPAAQAIFKAFCDRWWDCDSPDDDSDLLSGDPAALSLAAALEALADQVAPVEVSLRRGMRPGGTGSITRDEFKQDQRSETRRQILAIAAELRKG